MAEPLPRLRGNLEFMSSPVPDRPGLVVRDPFRYTDATLIVPPALVECLTFFDGEHTDLDLRQMLVQLTGDLRVGDIERQLMEALSTSGFLEDEAFERIRDERTLAFAQAAEREPVHAGSAYPDDAGDLRAVMRQYMDGDGTRPLSGLCGIAAPHVSPDGGWQSYRAAYAALEPELAGRTFVILGTSHYGEPDRFGLTRKSFLTPFGEALPDREAIDWLAENGGPAVEMEDYCHAVEHSIEFQVVFLQHVFGPSIRILPILCGPFFQSLIGGGLPESGEAPGRFLDALSQLAADRGSGLFWVMGIDMAHMGRRYGDDFDARAGENQMSEVETRDRERIARVLEGDRTGFWELVQRGRDPLKWCGSTPLYTFLRAVPEARGELLRYEQWNIDPVSVVTFGGLAFRR